MKIPLRLYIYIYICIYDQDSDFFGFAFQSAFKTGHLGTRSPTARPRCHPGKTPLQTSGSQCNVPGRSAMSISTCMVVISTEKHWYIDWCCGVCIYIYMWAVCFLKTTIYIYISSYACRFFQNNCTSKSFAEISLYLSHQASLKKDSHIPAHLKNMSMVESQRAPHAYRHASWRALCEGPGRAVCVAGSQNHIISK